MARIWWDLSRACFMREAELKKVVCLRRSVSPSPPSAPAESPSPPPAPPPSPPPATRDVWLWPFAHTSIWNMPLGSGAVFEPCNFVATKSNMGYDTEGHIITTASDPNVTILQVSMKLCSFYTPRFGPALCDAVQLQVPAQWACPSAPSHLEERCM